MTSMAGSRVSILPFGGTVSALAELVCAGQLVMLDGKMRPPRAVALSLRPEPEEPDAPVGPLTDERTWVEVVLVDGNDDPIAEEPYSIALPDGTTRRGQLGADGKVRFDDIPDGMCQVSFPELGQREAQEST